MAERIVLASGSATRAAMLRNAGVPFTQTRPGVDEEAVKEGLKADGISPVSGAEILAELKSRQNSLSEPDALVIGADQVLDVDGQWLDKPADRAAVGARLAALRGRVHRLHTAVVVCRNGDRLWHHIDSPSLWMRDLSDPFIDRYVANHADQVLGSVGAYQLEGAGIQLFSRIAGDYFAILGLPLLPLLQFLRLRGAIET